MSLMDLADLADYSRTLGRACLGPRIPKSENGKRQPNGIRTRVSTLREWLDYRQGTPSWAFGCS